MPVREPTAQTNDRDRVRDAADIVRIVGKHITLKPKGREFVGLCPFHDDHKPSMCVVPQKQIFHCFACGAGGDVFTFVQKYHGMDFREAIAYLASETGITLTPWRSSDADAPEGSSLTKSDLLGATALATEFFRAILHHEQHGLAARDMIAARGISDDMVERFAVGAAPARWDGLLLAARSKGISTDILVEAGLLKTKNDGSFYDTFRNRLIFPIHDQIGRVIAFGGRRLSDDDPAKYLNSPETRLFDKSSTLFGLHHASRAIQTQRTVVVVEGYTDVIACHQAGLTNVVATLGTALTTGHAATLRRLCDTIVLLFDGDDAGHAAAMRAVQVFFAQPVDVRIATLNGTGSKDPDEVLKHEQGVQRLNDVIDGAPDAIRVLFDDLRSSMTGRGVSGRARITEEFVDQLLALGVNTRMSPVRRRLIIRQIADITETDWQSIAAMMPAGRKPARARVRDDDDPAQGPPEVGPREHLIGCILCEPALLASATTDELLLLDPERFEHPATRALAEAILGLQRDGRAPSLQAVLARLDDDDAKAAAVAIATRVETETEGRRVFEHFRAVLQRIARDTTREPNAPDANDMPDLVARLERTRAAREMFGVETRALPGVARSPREHGATQ